MEVRVSKAFTAYPNGKKTAYAVGLAVISKETIDEFDLIRKGLVSLVKKKKPNEAE